MIENKTIKYRTEGEKDGKLYILDITDDVKKFVAKSGVKSGLVSVQSMHTTASVFVNEKENGLRIDFTANLHLTASPNLNYVHDDFSVRTENLCVGECANGQAHCKAIHLPTSVVLQLIDGELKLGTWQRILFMELDRARDREVSIMIMGE